jgi:hypothetical protein
MSDLRFSKGMCFKSLVCDPLGTGEARLRYNLAVRGFNRAMRRHERRCRRLGLRGCADTMAVIREGGAERAEHDEAWMQRQADLLARSVCGCLFLDCFEHGAYHYADDGEISGAKLLSSDMGRGTAGRRRRAARARTIAFFYQLAADACAKLVEPRRLLKEAEAKANEELSKGWKLESFSFGTVSTVNP